MTDRPLLSANGLARSCPAGYACVVSGGSWIPYPHLQLVNKAVTGLLVGMHPRKVMIWMPPELGKTEYFSHYLPSWLRGRFPSWNIGLIAHTKVVARFYGDRATTQYNCHARMLWGLDVSRSGQAFSRYPGGLHTFGVLGPTGGPPLDIAIIDDPVRSPQNVATFDAREATEEWYRSRLETRLAKDAKIILVQSRHHQDDLSARLWRRGGWKLINLPALAYDPSKVRGAKPDPLGRLPGEPLCPQMVSLNSLLETQRQHPQMFEAIYQQRPGAEVSCPERFEVV